MSTDMIATSPAPDDQNPVPEAKPETVEATTAIDPTTELSSVVNAPLGENELRDFHFMGEVELIAAIQGVARRYKTFNEYFRTYAPAITMLHKRYAKKGQRLPIDGKPTWDEFVKDTFGITSRHLRNLLNPPTRAAKKDPEPLEVGDVAALFARMKRKSFVTGMDEVLKELEPEDFAAALQDFAQLIADHYSQPDVTVSVTTAFDDEDDGASADDSADTDPDYESGAEQELACA